MRPLLPARLLAALLIVAACTPVHEDADGAYFAIARLGDYSAYRSSSNNRYVFSNEDSRHFMPGETVVIADLDGPGVVTHIWFTAASNEFGWPRQYRLRAYYDGKKTPSVDVPLGDFFAVGNGYEAELNSAMIQNTSLGRGRNSYWPMPFRTHCRITVTNEGARMKSLYYQVDWRKLKRLPDDVGYFHAYYRQERPAVAGRNYEFLAIHGKGQYVGTVLSVLQTQISWFGEGDDLFYVDGATKPQLYGTGSEDYFNEAWGLRPSSTPWTGSVVAEGERIGSRLSSYRWHVPDAIPFTTSIWAGIEHRGWTYNADGSPRTPFEERPDYFSSVAFWYQEGVNEELPEPPYGNERLPVGNAQQIVIQNAIKDVTTSNGTAVVQKNRDWGRDFLTLLAKGAGARINIPFDVTETGRYELVAEIAMAPNYGNYVALVDGQGTNLDLREPVSSEIPFPGPLVYHNYEGEVYTGRQQPLGFFHFTKGRHTVTLVCVGKDEASAGYDVGVFEVVLERLPDNVGEPDTTKALDLTPRFPPAPPAVAAGTPVFRGYPLSAYLDRLASAPAMGRATLVRALGNFGADGERAVPALITALADTNADVRIAAAWSLSQIGAKAGSATSALAHTLSDSNTQVRVMAAVALKYIGSAAAGAVNVLAQRLAGDSDDNVRRSAAAALGSMGAAAKDAVPVMAARLREEKAGLVRGTIATSLGDIGPAAIGALPALQFAYDTLKIGPAAKEAMLRIQGRPVDTWR